MSETFDTAAPVASPPAVQDDFKPDPMGFGDEAQQRADHEAQQHGVQTVTKVRRSYWGTEDVTYKWYFPDQEDIPEGERQFILYKKMNEGERSKYQKEVSDPVLVHRGSGDARMKVDPARDRAALIRNAVCGWNLWRGNSPTNYNDTQFDLWYKNADPEWIDELDKRIRKVNKWIRNEMSLKDAREERDRLIDLVKELEDAEEEKANSSNR